MITPNELNALLAKDSNDYTTADIDALKQSFADMSQAILSVAQDTSYSELMPEMYMEFKVMAHPMKDEEFYSGIIFSGVLPDHTPEDKMATWSDGGFYTSIYEAIYKSKAIFDAKIEELKKRITPYKQTWFIKLNHDKYLSNVIKDLTIPTTPDKAQRIEFKTREKAEEQLKKVWNIIPFQTAVKVAVLQFELK